LRHRYRALIVPSIYDVAAAVGDVKLDVEEGTFAGEEAVDDGRLLGYLALEALAVTVLQESSSGGQGRQGCEDESEDCTGSHFVMVKG
jgi:hypothetical protein